MPDSLPSTAPEGEVVERASWVHLPDVTRFRETWKNRNNDNGGALMDGAFFGLNGASILDTKGVSVNASSFGEMVVC